MITEKKSRTSFRIAEKIIVLSIIILGAAAYSFAQKNNKEVTFNSSQIENLNAALNSENIGLKKSAVYLAGYYKIDQAVKQLNIILNSSSADYSIRCLAAYSLYEIGNEECLNALEKASYSCNDKKLCLKCRMLTKNLAETNSGVVYN